MLIDFNLVVVAVPVFCFNAVRQGNIDRWQITAQDGVGKVAIHGVRLSHTRGIGGDQGTAGRDISIETCGDRQGTAAADRGVTWVNFNQ